MAMTSHFYDGPLTETDWAEHRMGAAAYGVEGPNDWKVSAVAGADRTVVIARGKGFGRGVSDESDADVTLQLDPVSAGTRWDLIVARRDWQPASGGPTYFAKVNGTATQAIPSGRRTEPGLVDDQPIALVQVTADKTAPTAIIDLRCWASSSGVEATHELAKTYLAQPGAAVKIGATLWRYEAQSNNLFDWKGYPLQAQPLQAQLVTSNGTSNARAEVDTFFPSFPNAAFAVAFTDQTFGPGTFKQYRKVELVNGRVRWRLYRGDTGAQDPNAGYTVDIIVLGY